jgi:hypothetical protein
VVDELTRLLGERGHHLIFEAHMREALRQVINDKLIDPPSREGDLRRRDEERSPLNTLTPEERHQYYTENEISDLKNYRHMSDQLDDLEFYTPDYVYDLRQRDPEFMDPLIHALRQRPKWQRREKAFERLKRMRESHAKKHPQGGEPQSS